MLLVSPVRAGEPAITPAAPPSTPDAGDKFINFASTSLWYLYGFNWDMPFASSHERDLITLEHFQDNAWGDLFLFVDFMNLSTEGRGYPETGFDLYGEVNPRLSLGKVTGEPLKFGPIKDLFFYSGMLEFGTSDSLENINRAFGTDIDKTQLRQLHGVALDLDLPGFAYSSINFFWRDDFDISGSTWQITYVWGIPFHLAGFDFIFKGFADYNGAEGGLVETFHTSPQLMMDLGAKILNKKNVLWVGTEVDIWINEYGVRGQDDVVPQLVMQFEF
jgi:nucleoside-specific outer membrane channel protein Tsx